jgi:tRNA pseudouridine38-40 synthase
MKGAFHYRLIVAYDGTRYRGWQTQPGRDTIQGRIEEPLSRLFGQRISIHGAGRTDAGVHARGQVASFRAGKRIELNTLVRALNANLPDDIRIMKAASASAGFHARFSARSKEYRYQIINATVMDPFLSAHAVHHPRELNLPSMHRLARQLLGRHDFAALSANPQREVESTVRTISRLTITKKGDLITIMVRADGFLYKMVRSIVGALLKVGRGEATADEMEKYVFGGKRTNFVQTAPALGLFLWKVWY